MYPNWCSGNSSSFGMAACILVISSRSKIVGRSGKSLIGLYVLGCCGVLPGLPIMITRAYCHLSGKCPRRKMLLYIVSSTTAFRVSFNTLPVMRSYTGALCRLVKFISLHTSAGVNSEGLEIIVQVYEGILLLQSQRLGFWMVVA